MEDFQRKALRGETLLRVMCSTNAYHITILYVPSMLGVTVALADCAMGAEICVIQAPAVTNHGQALYDTVTGRSLHFQPDQHTNADSSHLVAMRVS